MSGRPRGCPGVVGIPPRMSRSVRKTLPDVQKAYWMSGSSRKAIRNVREWLEGPPGRPEDVQEALSYIREWSGGSLRNPVAVERPSRMSGSGRETLSDVREALSVSGSCPEPLTDSRVWLGGPPGCLAVFGKPSRMSGRPSRISGSCPESLTESREWLGGPPGCLAVVGKPSRMFEMPSRMSRSVQKALPDVRE